MEILRRCFTSHVEEFLNGGHEEKSQHHLKYYVLNLMTKQIYLILCIYICRESKCVSSGIWWSLGIIQISLDLDLV